MNGKNILIFQNDYKRGVLVFYGVLVEKKKIIRMLILMTHYTGLIFLESSSS